MIGPKKETPQQWSERLENYLLERTTPKETEGYKRVFGGD